MIKPHARQFLTFICVGGISAIIDVGCMRVLMLWQVHYVLAATAGFLLGFAINFTLHTLVTFKSAYSKTTLVKFMLVVLLNYGLTISIIAVSSYFWGSAMAGKILSLPVVAVSGFLLSKRWIYK